MQAQNTVSPVEQDQQIDGAILGLLLDSPVPWSTHEVEREIGDQIVTADGIGRLTRAGLVHRLDGFVFASRAAVHAGGLAW